MSVRLKFALALTCLFLYVLAGLGVLWAAVSSSVSAEDRSVLERVLNDQASLAVFLGVLFLLGLGVIVALFFNLYVRPPARIARETRLIVSANPSHRIEASGPAELVGVADAVNELADRSHRLQGDIDSKVAVATADLERERSRLAAVMSELTLAVLVCNLDGRIVLYNEAATKLVGETERASGLIGLGRSVFGVLDRSVIKHAIERISPGAEGSVGESAVRLTAAGAGGQLLRVSAAPVSDGDSELTGLVLILENVTRGAEISERRDALIRSLIEGTRASVGTVRAAVESMLDYPDMAVAERRRFTAAIRDEALKLSALVDDALGESGEYLISEWPLEDVLAQDLVAAAQRSLESELGQQLWQSRRGRRLATDRRAGGRTGHHAPREPVVSGDLGRSPVARPAACRTERAPGPGLGGAAGERENPGSLGHAAARRGWRRSFLDAEKGAREARRRALEPRRHRRPERCVRLLLPIGTEDGESRPPPRYGRPVERHDEPPELYDFDLFRSPEPDTGWDQRRLDELGYTVFDTETTGLDPSADEIISIGAVRALGGRLLRRETFDRLVDPGRPVSAASRAVHGISPDVLDGEPTIDEVLPLFARFAEDTVLVGHNVAFDLRFLEHKEERTGVRLSQPVLDTLLLSAVLYPDEVDHSLETMADASASA